MANTILIQSRQADATAPGATALKVGELAVNTFDGKMYLGTDIDGSASRSAGGAATASTYIGGGILDEDNMASDSATNLATQQSIKAYIDGAAGTGDITGVTLAGDSGSAADTSANVDLTIAGGTGITTSATSTTVTITGDTASATAAGVVELATTAETTTGTDAARAVTPDGLKDGYQGSTNVTTLGTIATGVWSGTALVGGKIANDAIDSQHYADGSIDTAHIANDQITNALMADDAIDSAEIANGAVDLAHMSANSVDSDQYVDGSVDNVHLANSSVTVGGSAVSLGGTVTGANIAAALNSDLGGNFTIGNQSSDTCTITGDLTVSGTTTTTQSIAVGTADTIIFEGATADAYETTLTVTDPTADRTITLPNVTGTVVTTGDTATVTATMLAANSVDSSELVNGSIDTSHIANDQITNALMADDAIDSAQLADGSVDTAHIADNQVTLAKMAGLARGKLIYGDASGDPAALGAGANGKILVADANGDLSWTTLSGDASLSAGALTIASTSIENGMLAGSIANAKLSNSAITIAGASTSLGGTISAATIASAIDSETMTLTNTTISGGAYST